MKHKPISLAKEIADKLTPIYEHMQERQQVAWWLLQAITQFDDAQLVAQAELDLSDAQEQQLAQWLQEHIQEHKPLQYILGWVPFGSLKILVQPPILIPRPETEEWSFRVAQELQVLADQELKILDLCTGTGCIALAFAHALPDAHITATDINPDALNLAQKNANANDLSTISFIQSDIFDALDPSTKFDLIVANPPYITQLEWSRLDPLVKNWEQRDALVANDDGLAIIKKIILGAFSHLKKNKQMAVHDIAQLYIEIGYTQGPSVKQLMSDAGFVNVTIEKDLEGKDRIVSGSMP